MQLQVGVKVFLKNTENKFLVLHRSKDKYPDIEHPWDIVGGRIEPGKTLVDNLKREVYEETKLELKHHPVLLAAQDILLSDKHVVRLTYLSPIEGEPTLDADHDDFKWLDVQELIEIEGLDPYLSQLLTKASSLDQAS